jgi:hypothetical protein
MSLTWDPTSEVAAVFPLIPMGSRYLALVITPRNRAAEALRAECMRWRGDLEKT